MKLHLSENCQYLIIDSCTTQEYEQLKISFNKEVKNYRFNPKYKSGTWDGKINFMVGKYLPATTYAYLMEVCKQYNFECEIDGLANMFDLDLDFDEFKECMDDLFEKSPKKPRYYQIDAAFNMLRNRNCMIQIATGGGKTFIAFMVFMYLLYYKKCVDKVCMVVPKVDLVLQPTGDFMEYNNGKFDIKIQQIYSGCKVMPDANIFIGTYQSLRDECPEFFNKFGCVLTDECLHPDTLIRMYDGTQKKISEINVGEKVYTFNTNTKKQEIHKVEYVYKNLSKNQQMYKLEMEDGRELKVTGNHKVLLTDGTWKKVEDLTQGDDIVDTNIC